MKKLAWALLVTALAAGLVYFESQPRGSVIHATLQGWLAANALSENPQTITAVEMPNEKSGLAALDAALCLRAALPLSPKMIAFLDPIDTGESSPLFLSKLSEAKIPVVFTSSTLPAALPHLTLPQSVPGPITGQDALVPRDYPAGLASEMAGMEVGLVARAGSQALPTSVLQACVTGNSLSLRDLSGAVPGVLRAGRFVAPVDAHGHTGINPLASLYVQHIAFDQLMLRAERADQGGISVDLQTLFQGRMVVILRAGENGARALSAWQNSLLEFPLPGYARWLPLALVFTLPWWRERRVNRALIALGVTGFWLLLSLAAFQEFHVSPPLLAMILLPVLALIPPGPAQESNKVQQGKLST